MFRPACPARLKEQATAIARSNLLRTGELVKCLNLLQSQGITAVPMKGPVLAASAYGSLVLREFNDLDILVRERDVTRARDILIAEGYCPTYHLPPSQDGAVIAIAREYKLYDERRDKTDRAAVAAASRSGSTSGSIRRSCAKICARCVSPVRRS